MTHCNSVWDPFRNDFHAVISFLQRVPYDGPVSHKRGIESLRIFMEMLKKMTNSEKHDHFEDWMVLFSHVLKLFVKDTSNKMNHLLNRVFRELLRIIGDVFRAEERSFAVDILLRECARVLNVEMDYVLQLCMDEKTIIAGEDWRFKKYRLLTDELKVSNKKVLCVTLIKYGFQYRYDKEYFKTCCYNLAYQNIEVNGRSIAGNFSEEVFRRGNLRKQLAVELFLTLFTKVEFHYEEVVRHLWRSVPFPYITGEEMYNFFHRHYGRHTGDPTLEEVCNVYVECNTLFAVPAQKQPRSLQVLCKVRIRKSLLEANGIVYDKDIDSLHLPTYIKRFLQLRVD